MTAELSVIIPHKDDHERLAICIQALSKQTLNPSIYELIVVDNMSARKVHLDNLELPRLRLDQCKIAGSYAARNKGISLAKGKYFAFTDSDCIPDSHWLEVGLRHLQKSQNKEVIGGLIRLSAPDLNQASGVELFEYFTAFNQKLFIERDHFSVTANLMTSRQVFEEVGLFDNSLLSGGDHEWCNRAYGAGFEIRYLEKLSIEHPPRTNWREFLKKERRVAQGFRSLNKRSGVRPIRANFWTSAFRQVSEVQYAFSKLRRSEYHSFRNFLKLSLTVLLLPIVRIIARI